MAASEEQLRQAYTDRVVQLPRREYSHAAITSRKKLIEKAYVVLSDPKERKAYDKLYLAHAYGSESAQEAAVAIEKRALNTNGDINSQNISIDISQDEVAGALLLLQELGEYELVLQLGRPYLINRNGTSKQDNREESQQSYSLAVERPDVVLTVAIACLELGREQWQQGHYENAGISLETGEELLAREGLFLNLGAEIQSDLYRLRPYRILELLASQEKTAERAQGLQLLQDILNERGGIDGNGNDQSGLSVDDFIRFIQQLRNYLTVAEQHKLFEEESKRPSAVATYLAVYALIARGFTQPQPALIRQAKQMLLRLGRRQDVHLEQALCALLLGQTEEATRALELSQEYEALAFIRENSHDSPDLLPGLCLYVEDWLQKDVFPHFQDLANKYASLKDYFANQKVQTYLEALPTETETHEPTGINHQSVSHSPTTRQTQRSNSTLPQRQFQTKRTPEDEVAQRPNQKRREYLDFSQSSYGTSSNPSEIPVAPLSNSEPIAARSNYHNLNGSARATGTPPQPHKRRNRAQSKASGYTSENPVHRRRNRNPQAQLRLLLMVLGSVAGIVVLWFLLSTTFGLLKNLFFPGSSLKGEQLVIELNQPPVPIPAPNSTPQLPAGELTEETAGEIVQAWLDTKAAALGQDHDISALENILVGATLTKWRSLSQQERSNNRYRKYEHSVKIESVKTDQNQAVIEASVSEVTQFYENGQMKKKPSDDKLRVKYNLVRVDGAWRIRDMSVVNTISLVF